MSNISSKMYDNINKNQIKRKEYTYNDSGSVFLLIIIAPIILSFAFIIVLALVGSFFNASYSDLLKIDWIKVLSGMIAQIGFLIVFFVYNGYKKIDFVSASKINFKTSPHNIILSIIIGLICLFGLNYLVGLVDKFFEFINYKASSELPLPLDNAGWLILNIFLLALVPAVAEELLFRGVIFNSLKNKSNALAIFGSAFLFMLVHGNPYQTLYPFAFGLVLALIAWKTRSVVTCMIAHFVNNATVVMFSYFKIDISLPFNIWFVFIAFGLAIAAGVSIWFICKLLRPSKAKVSNLEDVNDILNSNIATDNPAAKKSNLMKYGIAIGVLTWVFTFVYYVFL